MFQCVDVVPEYIRQRYPNYQSFQQALYTGEIVRDYYGNLHLREEFQPQLSHGYNPYCLMAQPVIENSDDRSLVEFNFFNIENVRGYYKEEPDGFLIELVSAEDIARGAGLTKQSNGRYSGEVLSQKWDNQFEAYEVIRWNRFNDYAQRSLETLQQYIDPRVIPYIKFPIDRDSYIPIELAVRVINKCNSKKAEEFQSIVAVKISNEIRNLNRQKHEKVLQEMQKRIDKQTRTIEYYKKFTNSDQLFRMTEISKSFNLTPNIVHLILEKYGYIYKSNNSWIIKKEFQNRNLMILHTDSNVLESFWTAEGKEFVSNVLISLGFVISGFNNDELAIQLLSNNTFTKDYSCHNKQ